MLITVQPNPSWQLSLAQLSPSLFLLFCDLFILTEYLHSTRNLQKISFAKINNNSSDYEYPAYNTL